MEVSWPIRCPFCFGIVREGEWGAALFHSRRTWEVLGGDREAKGVSAARGRTAQPGVVADWPRSPLNAKSLGRRNKSDAR